MGSDGGSWDKGTKPRRALKGVPRQKPGRARRRGRKRQLRRSEEESEEVMGKLNMFGGRKMKPEPRKSETFARAFKTDSDQYSDLSDSDHQRRGLRRGQHQQVNYRETSESSDSSRVSADEKKSKARTRKEALSSDYSDCERPNAILCLKCVAFSDSRVISLSCSIPFFQRIGGR